MKYDFMTKLEREGTGALAVDGVGSPGFAPAAPQEGFSFLPMWVADMNFKTCPAITEEIIKRAEHPAFGYYLPSEEYYDLIIRWHESRNHVAGLTKEDIGYENGVLGGVVSAMKVLASPGEPVLLHSPTYIGFTGSINDNGYRIVLSPLVKDAQGIYRMDYEDMEKKIRENHIRVAIFCSPHNPTGRVWEREEIRRAMEVYERNGVYVISDEIWSDIILDGYEHIPTQSVSAWARSHVIAFYAPSKTFNLAGLIGSYHIIYDPWLRERVTSVGHRTHYNEMNVLSMHALIGAYKDEGQEWTDEMRAVISGNVKFACDYIAAHYDGVTVSRPQGTYMLFLDCTEWCAAHGKDIGEVLGAGWSVGVGWQDGRPFHGEHHIRMNLALPFSYVEEAFDRLDRYVFNAR